MITGGTIWPTLDPGWPATPTSYLAWQNTASDTDMTSTTVPYCHILYLMGWEHPLGRRALSVQFGSNPKRSTLDVTTTVSFGTPNPTCFSKERVDTQSCMPLGAAQNGCLASEIRYTPRPSRCWQVSRQWWRGMVLHTQFVLFQLCPA
uniref:Uncharacterized protein n=1 Tax=Eutreptiella gymnastica TaxID=73025 RepID=A0A7S1NJL8_9EUGL